MCICFLWLDTDLLILCCVVGPPCFLCVRLLTVAYVFATLPVHPVLSPVDFALLLLLCFNFLLLLRYFLFALYCFFSTCTPSSNLKIIRGLFVTVTSKPSPTNKIMRFLNVQKTRGITALLMVVTEIMVWRVQPLCVVNPGLYSPTLYIWGVAPAAFSYGAHMATKR